MSEHRNTRKAMEFIMAPRRTERLDPIYTLEVTVYGRHSAQPGGSADRPGTFSCREPVGVLNSCQCWHATVYVTDRRVRSYREFELKRSEIRGFTVGKLLLCIATVTIWRRGENRIPSPAFPSKSCRAGCSRRESRGCRSGRASRNGPAGPTVGRPGETRSPGRLCLYRKSAREINTAPGRRRCPPPRSGQTGSRCRGERR